MESAVICPQAHDWGSGKHKLNRNHDLVIYLSWFIVVRRKLDVEDVGTDGMSTAQHKWSKKHAFFSEYPRVY